ncbi:MAG: riboflavin biosynthesis protein RibD [Phycisphaerae bacterium]|nr:riboflavin biosynthesis protein RibD [Phycisphaerae bacterium]
MLRKAAWHAVRAAGYAEPNPLVGAVIVRDGEVLGVGHHQRFGGLHAEREALADCQRRGHDPHGSTVYVTLEPCRHHGKQPPCTDALIDAGVRKVVYARPDPAGVSGGGADVLRAAGIEVEVATDPGVAHVISEPFVHRVRTGLPWVIAKWAQTIDGRIATRTRESQWISGPMSRRRVHRLRARVDGVLTGLGTILADDPMLNARDVRRVRRDAARVVVDPDLETPIEAAVVRTASEIPTIIACSKDLITADICERRRRSLEDAGVKLLGVPEATDQPGRLRLDMLLCALVERFAMANVLVESGAVLLGSLLEADLVNEARVYVAPLMLADAEALPVATGRAALALSEGRRFALGRAKRVGEDMELTYVRRAVSP